MKITFKRIACIVGLLAAVGFGVFVYGGWQMFGDELRAVRTLRMLQERTRRISHQPYILTVTGTLPFTFLSAISIF